MPFHNTYTPPEPLSIANYHLLTPREEYDLNWCYSSIPPSLSTEGGVKLVPLIPSLHAEKLYKLYSDPRALQDYKYLPYGPFSTLDEFLTKLELA
ncbi:hypothetical protein JCM5353_004333, partial [Sporobolomyces roseus]